MATVVRENLALEKMEAFLAVVFAKMGGGDTVNAALMGMMRQLTKTMLSQLGKAGPDQLDGLLGWLAKAVDQVRDPNVSVEELKDWLST